MNYKKNTDGTRLFESRKCKECGNDYEAPKKLRGKGIIGNGLCPGCIKAANPHTKTACPVCNTPFTIQAGHKRQTCSRICQQALTCQRRRDKLVAAATENETRAQELERLLATELAAKKEKDAQRESELREAARLKEAQEKEAAATREREEAAIKSALGKSGDSLSRVARGAAAVRKTRSRRTAGSGAAVTAGA